MSRVRLALLEEQTLFRKSLCHSIERDDRFQVVCETCEADGADTIVRAQPDVVLFGIDFHRGDPVDAAHALKSACQGVRVCLMAHESRTGLVARGLARDAIDGFILKDVGMWELARALLAVAEGTTYVDSRVAVTMTPQDKTFDNLSERERDVVRLIALGLSNKEISSKLVLSQKTIKNHVSRIFTKLNVSARTQAAIHAIKLGIA